MNGQLSFMKSPLPAPDGTPDHTQPEYECVPLNLKLDPLNTVVGDVSGNEALCEESIRAAIQQKVQLLILPELTICGYPPEDLLMRRDFLDACHDAVRRLARLTEGEDLAVLVGTPQLLSGKVYNAAVLLQNGKTEYVAQKTHLPNYGVFDEKRYFTEGHEVAIREIHGARVGITICEDLWVDGPPISVMKPRSVELVVNLSASPYHREKAQERVQLFQERAVEAGCPLAYCNLLGGQDELVFDGHCLIFSSTGQVLLEREPFDGRPLLAGVKTTPTGPDPIEAEREVYAALTTAVRDYATKTGFKRALLGLSGGIDSALVMLIALDALGAENVATVVMPSPHSSHATQNDARVLGEGCGVEVREVAIGEIMKTYDSALTPYFTGRDEDVTEENIQARIRGNILMAMSNKFGELLLSTGNKSEMAVGYCTLYGDMAGGFAVLKDCPKLLVYQLTEWRLTQGGISEEACEALRGIIERPPSAELKPDQEDSDSLPPYEVLDPILTAYVEEDRSLQAIVEMGYDEATVRRVVQLVMRAEYKRRQSPPGPKLTPRAFGRERRWPIVNSFKAG